MVYDYESVEASPACACIGGYLRQLAANAGVKGNPRYCCEREEDRGGALLMCMYRRKWDLQQRDFEDGDGRMLRVAESGS
jgi:hypothetical protein